jgi:uncharacterized protein with PIN domain
MPATATATQSPTEALAAQIKNLGAKDDARRADMNRAMSKDGQMDSVVVKAMAQLQDALHREYEASNAVDFHAGSRIMLPRGMTMFQAASAIVKIMAEEEDNVSTRQRFVGHPSDLLASFTRAMRETFGRFIAQPQMVQSFFGAFEIPGQTLTVQIAHDKTVNCPVGKVAVPGFPISMTISPKENEKDLMKSDLYVEFEFQRKYQPLVDEIVNTTQRFLRLNSIFQGQAIDSKFKFLDLDNPVTVVYSDQEKAEVDAHIFYPIMYRKALIGAGESVQSTILLEGTYGTGKTLTALTAARMAVQNGWTFLLAKGDCDISQMLEFAKRYEPSVIFYEDIDVVVGGPRTREINEILNTVDGVLSKTSQVMFIITTNHPERINAAMKRAGRISHIIRLGHVDTDSIVRLVRAVASGQLEGDLDGAVLLAAAPGYSQAFIAQAVRDAKRYAMARANSPIVVPITQEDIVHALRGLKSQHEATYADAVYDPPTIDQAFTALTSSAATAAVKAQVPTIVEDTSKQVMKLLKG